jgi:hypothetical protein
MPLFNRLYVFFQLDPHVFILFRNEQAFSTNMPGSSKTFNKVEHFINIGRHVSYFIHRSIGK